MALPTRTKLTTVDATAVYTVPVTKRAAFTVNISALLACKVKAAITSGAAPADADWFEPGQTLAAGAVLERTMILLPADHKVFVQTDTVNSVAVQVWGIEEPV